MDQFVSVDLRCCFYPKVFDDTLVTLDCVTDIVIVTNSSYLVYAVSVAVFHCSRDGYIVQTRLLRRKYIVVCGVTLRRLAATPRRALCLTRSP